MEKFLRVNLLDQHRPQATREGATQARDSDEGREPREPARELLWREPGPEYGAGCANRWVWEVQMEVTEAGGPLVDKN
jgi:hypothetical protein